MYRLVLPILLLAGCGPRLPDHTVEPWPEADQLFRGDSHWLGSDDAYSIPLGEDRILWVFGDTFVATSEAGVRSESTMVHNTIGLQTGMDPTSAAISFHWDDDGEGNPAAFFPGEGEDGFWPGDGELVEDTLLMFLMRVRKTDEGLGFEVVDAVVDAVCNPDDPPEQWSRTRLTLPANDWQVILGSGSVLVHGEFLYAFSASESGGHDVYLVRWPLEEIRALDLSKPRWWAGGSWKTQEELDSAPTPLFTDAQTEFTVHLDGTLDRWLEFQAEGFGAADVAVRASGEITGRWSARKAIYTPEESGRAGVFVYSIKAHPELEGGGLPITYCTNHEDFGQLVADDSIYYPRFLRLLWE